MLTGDSQARARAFWLKACPSLLKDVTVLKLAHHGSRNGTDAKWLDLTRPEIAVASLGADNDYGHPHPETLALLERPRHPPAADRPRRHGRRSSATARRWDVTTSRRGRDVGGADEFAAGARKLHGGDQPSRATARTPDAPKTRDARVKHGLDARSTSTPRPRTS